jgi:hypothetical protein
MKIFSTLFTVVLVSSAMFANEVQINVVAPEDKDEKFESTLEHLRQNREVEGGAVIIGEPSTSNAASKLKKAWDKNFENSKNVTKFGEKAPTIPKKKQSNNKGKKGGKKNNNKKKKR